MRLSNNDLKEITARTQPKAQANWFKRFYGIELPHDRKGVIITQQAWEALVSAKCGMTAKGAPINYASQERPQVRLRNA